MPAGLRSGHPVRRVPLAALLTSTLAIAQTPPKSTAQKATTHRANELTLAGLRPGRDAAAKATRLYHGWPPQLTNNGEQLVWLGGCRGNLFTIDLDGDQRIQVLRVTKGPRFGDCVATKPPSWKTGRGLRLSDSTAKVTQLYGEPDSRSPSTKNGQPLELWYYAFDWAGPDVPQVMEVLCTKEQDGQPGRVEEITLAAPSL